jgi:ABC-type dipeptide/oligopeptide/nickel transport system ATPase subunit
MTELLRLESCSAVREGRSTPVIQDISLTVTAGERHLITGPSGAGKTTLGLVIAGLLKPSSGRRTLAPAMRRHPAPIRMVFQDPFAGMNPRWTVRHWLKDNCPTLADPNSCVDLCDQLDLDLDLLDKHPLELSGGECQRFNLVGALLGNPLLLILDEATSMVDRQAARAMESLVQSRRERSDTAVVVIEHNAEISDGQLCIQLG